MQQSLRSYPCPTYFCGCQTIQNGFQPQRTLEVDIKIYLLIMFIFIVIIIAIKIGIDWFLYKDFYPLKQKSPILCIMLVVSISGQMLLYPIYSIVQYFTNNAKENSFRLKFRAVQAGLQFSVFMIYLLRCLRVSYAHNTHSSRSKHFSFRLFQKQYLLALSIGFVSIIKVIIVLFDNLSDQTSIYGTILHDFSLPVQWQVPLTSLNDFSHYIQQIQYMYRQVLLGFFWHCVMVYCLYLHKNINERYSMKLQLLIIIVMELCTSAATIVLMANQIKNYGPNNLRNILFEVCSESTVYPLTQIIKIISLVIILGVSIILPLFQTKVYHSLLPTGRHYGFIKTMRDFLMQEQFRRVFTKYLEYLDQKNQNNINMTLLQFWKKMMVIKMNRKQGELEKLQSLKNLIYDVQDILFIDQSELIINLKDSIVGLEESLQNSQVTKQKYRQSINEKVDELEKMALQRLDRIYVKSYTQTQSYRDLKLITQDYKRINLNLIMLNLALIVDSDNSFS